MNGSILSASKIIGAVLNDSAEVKQRVNSIFPVVAAQEAVMPYVCYRRIKSETNPAKGVHSADTATVCVHCYTAKYGEGVELAEAVRSALDGCQCRIGNLSMRSCTMTGAQEACTEDAYVQELIFTIKI